MAGCFIHHWAPSLPRARAHSCVLPPTCLGRGAAAVGPPRQILTLAAAASVLLAVAATPSPAEASLFHFAAPRPVESLGARGGDRHLSGCPASPNCISTSENAEDSHYVPPWEYPGGSVTGAVEELREVLGRYEGEGVKIVEERKTQSSVGDGWYIAAEFETPLMGFVDDVEFLFSPDAKTVEYRSASRIGQDDLSANRKRIKNLRILLEKSGWKSVGYN